MSGQNNKATASKNQPNSFTCIPNHVLDNIGQLFDQPTDFVVYLVLLRHAGNDKVCFPSIKTIAAKSGLSRRVIPIAVDRLIRKGLIIKEKSSHEKHNGNRSNRYYINAVQNDLFLTLVHPMHPPSAENAPPLVQKMHPKNTNYKKTQLKTPPPTPPCHERCENEIENQAVTKVVEKKEKAETMEGKCKENNVLQNPVRQTQRRFGMTIDPKLVWNGELSDCSNELKGELSEILQAIEIPYDRQRVLNELGFWISKENIIYPAKYLSKLVKSFLDKTLVFSSEAKNDPHEIAKKEDERTEKACEEENACPICNGKGAISVITKNHIRTSTRCTHNEAQMNRVFEKMRADGIQVILNAEPEAIAAKQNGLLNTSKIERETPLNELKPVGSLLTTLREKRAIKSASVTNKQPSSEEAENKKEDMKRLESLKKLAIDSGFDLNGHEWTFGELANDLKIFIRRQQLERSS